MLINQDFSVDRTKYIGGSDIGAILGLSKFRTPLEVWMEKTGKEVPIKDSLPLRFGSFAESFVADEYARATGQTLVHDQSTHIHAGHSFMSAHIDRFVIENKSNEDFSDSQGTLPSKILECKTANPFVQHEWGEVGTDHVPMAYLCQCIWYMAITNLEKTDLAVLFGNSDFRIYEIQRDKDLENAILEKAKQFWNEHVLKDIPPVGISEKDYQTLFKKGDSSKSIEASIEIYQMLSQYHIINNEIAKQEEQISQIKQRLMNQMQDAESLLYHGKIIATWKAPKPSYRLDSKRLEANEPELYQSYLTPIQNSRRLVIKDFEFKNALDHEITKEGA